MKPRLVLPLLVAGLGLASLLVAQPASAPASPPSDSGSAAMPELDAAAESYVKLVLAVGQHDPEYVDAYYGPAAWKEEALREKRSLADLASAAQALSQRLRAVESAPLQGLLQQRHHYLATQLRAVEARISQLAGRKLSFDEESRRLYDTVLPEPPAERIAALRAKLAALVPGDGPLAERLEQYECRFFVPKDKVDAVMRAAIAECRRRTRARIALPDCEEFKLEYVTGKSWSGYNGYLGGFRSLIQINLDLPFRVSQAIGLAAHEGYPGHHVHGVLVEQNLVKQHGWAEYQVFLSFAPSAVVAEGLASFAPEVVFPLEERVSFAREVLFPLAGLDPAEAERYFEILDLKRDFGAVGAAILRRFVDGRLTDAEAVRLLVSDALMFRARAEKRLAFARQYGSYVATYETGYPLVKQYVEAHGGTPENPARRWELLARLLSTPPIPAELR